MMTPFLIVLGVAALFVLGPVLAMRPSPRQAQLARLRARAVAAGLRVRVETGRSRESVFLELAEAYGGAVARWPAAEREAAATLMAAEPEFVRQSLAAADRLDAVLGAWAPLSVPHGLREAVIARAAQEEAARGAGDIRT